MSKFIFDIETNNLLQKLTKCHIVACWNLETLEMLYWLDGDLGWQEVLGNATLLIGHNILTFDFPALEKLFKWKPNPATRIEDTLVLSQALNYKRFGNDGHSLEAWGVSLGYPKVEHEDWETYSPEMLHRCLTDVELNTKVWDVLKKEARDMVNAKPYMRTYIAAEYAASSWGAEASLKGWPFDMEAAIPLQAKMKVEMDATILALTHKLGSKTVAVDKKLGVVEPKMPQWVKSGAYNSHTANWFGINPATGQDDDRLVEGVYSRVEFKALDLESVADVKIFLFRNGWEPTEWNTKKEPDPKRPDRMIFVKTSPKITEDSLEFLGGDGKLYCDFLTTKSRYSILSTWIENVDDNGNLHGEMMCIGTPSMRARHSIIVNVPAVESPWGKEMRSLFTKKKGWKLIGCDSAGNQARGLAHYLQSPEYVELLLKGDIHTYNANAIDTVLKGMNVSWDKWLLSQGVKADLPHSEAKLKAWKDAGEEIPKLHTLEENLAKRKRGVAKRILYAFLFGASGAKLWGYVFGIQDKTLGNKMKTGFQKAVPGLKDLLETLDKIYGKTSQFGSGYIPGIAGNRIYCDSFHKLLVYLLQACEKATCAAALMLTVERLKEEGIPYQPCIFYHDEIDFMVPDEYDTQAAAIGKQAFVDGPKLFGIQIMDGDAKIGDTWYDVH